MEISKKLVLINSFSSVLTRLLSISVLIWLQQYLLKRITPEEYSLLPVLYSVMIFAPLLTTILTSGLGRYVVDAYAKHDDERITQIVSTMFPILCVTGAVFLVGGWTFAWNIDKVLTVEPERLWDARIMMGLLMFSAALRLPLAPFTLGLFVTQKFVLENLIELATVISRLAILFLLLFGVSTRVLWVVSATVSAEVLNLFIVLIFSRRFVPTLRFHISYIRWPIAKEITRFGGWEFCAQLSSTIVMSADAILLNTFGTAKDVANFHIGSLPFKHIDSTVCGASTSLGPATIALHATGRVGTLRQLYQRTGKIALWVALFLALPLAVYSREFIDLYVGENYKDAATVQLLMLLFFPLAYGTFLAPSLARAAGRIRSWALLSVSLHVCNLLLTIYLVAFLRLGAIGCALGSLSAFVVGYPLFIWSFGLRLADISIHSWFRNTLTPGLVPSLCTACVLIILKSVYSVDSWTELGIHCICGWFCYAFSCYLLLDESDLVDLARFTKYLRNRTGSAREISAGK